MFKVKVTHVQLKHFSVSKDNSGFGWGAWVGVINLGGEGLINLGVGVINL